MDMHNAGVGVRNCTVIVVSPHAKSRVGVLVKEFDVKAVMGQGSAFSKRVVKDSSNTI